MRVQLRLTLALALGATGCGPSTAARLQFANQSPVSAALRLSTASAPLLADGTSLRIKMLSVSLAEDVDPVTLDNVGTVSNVWINPQCGGSADHCNVSGMDTGPGPEVTQYFDFARSSDEVNAELNAQHLPVDPASYKYVRLEFCRVTGGQTVPTDPTLMWKAPGMAHELPFTSGDCGRTSLPFSPPLEIKAGDKVTITLGYDLEQAIVVGAPAPDSRASIVGHTEPGGGWHFFRACFYIVASTRACMDFPEFAPTASMD
jgi:hypothetical protein